MSEATPPQRLLRRSESLGTHGGAPEMELLHVHIIGGRNLVVKADVMATVKVCQCLPAQRGLPPPGADMTTSRRVCPPLPVQARGAQVPACHQDQEGYPGPGAWLRAGAGR